MSWSALARVLLTAVLPLSLTACGAVMSWDRSYNLRQWEKLRIGSELAFLNGDFPRSEQLIRSALQYAEKLGSGDFRTGTTLLQLGDALMKEGKTVEARLVFTQSLECLERSLVRAGKESERRLFMSDAGKVLLSLGSICLQLGDLPAAEGYFQKAEQLYELLLENYGMERITEEIGQSLYGLAVVNLKQGRAANAEKFYRLAVDSAASEGYSAVLSRKLKALEPFLKAVPTLPSTAIIQSDERWRNLVLAGQESFSSKSFGEAERQFQLAIEEARKLGPDNDKLAQTYRELAASQEWLMKLEDAEDSYRKALALRDKASPGGDQESDKIFSKLANFAALKKNYKQAIGLLDRQYKLRQRLYGDDSVEVGESLSDLAAVELAQGRTDEATAHALEAWTVLGDSSQTRGKAVVAYESLSQSLLQLGKYGQARQASLKLMAACGDRSKHLMRKLSAGYRLAAISAQEGKQATAAAQGTAANSAVLAVWKEPQQLVPLTRSMNDEAKMLAAHGQLKAGAAMAEWAIQLLSRSKDTEESSVARLAVLESLCSIERSLGHDARVDQLSARIADLKRQRR